MNVKLYVGNLPYSATEDELQTLFSQAGTVASVSVITDRATGRSKGFGFVEMSSQAEAEEAIKTLDNHSMGGREIRVNIAKPREERGDRRGGSSGSRGTRHGDRDRGRKDRDY
jgi:cold-inducible RNA-binding protein